LHSPPNYRKPHIRGWIAHNLKFTGSNQILSLQPLS
jgi:hypothetical protein